MKPRPLTPLRKLTNCEGNIQWFSSGAVWADKLVPALSSDQFTGWMHPQYPILPILTHTKPLQPTLHQHPIPIPTRHFHSNSILHHALDLHSEVWGESHCDVAGVRKHSPTANRPHQQLLSNTYTQQQLLPMQSTCTALLVKFIKAEFANSTITACGMEEE